MRRPDNRSDAGYPRDDRAGCLSPYRNRLRWRHRRRWQRKYFIRSKGCVHYRSFSVAAGSFFPINAAACKMGWDSNILGRCRLNIADCCSVRLAGGNQKGSVATSRLLLPVTRTAAARRRNRDSRQIFRGFTSPKIAAALPPEGRRNPSVPARQDWRGASSRAATWR